MNLVDLDELSTDDLRQILAARLGRESTPAEQLAQLDEWDGVLARVTDPDHVDPEAAEIIRRRLADLDSRYSAADPW